MVRNSKDRCFGRFEIRKIVVSDLDLFLSLLGVGFIVVVSLDVSGRGRNALIFFRDYDVSGQRLVVGYRQRASRSCIKISQCCLFRLFSK